MEWLRSAHDHPLIDPEARDAAETCLEYQLGRRGNRGGNEGQCAFLDGYGNPTMPRSEEIRRLA